MTNTPRTNYVDARTPEERERDSKITMTTTVTDAPNTFTKAPDSFTNTPRAWGEMSVNEKAVLLGTTNLQTIDAVSKLIRTIEDEAVRRERERIREIVEFERVHFWGTPELEKQTNINNMVVDNILQALTPTKTDNQTEV